jgi:Xaa-Pro dipeptidase
MFVPRLSPDFAVWMGKLRTLDDYKSALEVDEVVYTDTISDWVASLKPSTIFVLEGTNTDSGEATKTTATFTGIEKYDVDRKTLYPILTYQRVIKTSRELDVMRYVNRVSSRAHIEVMKQCRIGMSQRQLESLFLHNVYFHGGCRHASYTCICATGSDCAVLHYPDNDKPVIDGQMALLDMGGEYCCYASDITCSFPVNGRFTAQQKIVYQGVLDAQRNVMKGMKPGASWVDLHVLAMRTAMDHLRAANIIKGTWEELASSQIPYIFQPHGMGHLLGMDVHDVGGVPEGTERPKEDMLRRLRNLRTLDAGMVLTVEPGIYFNHSLLEKAFADPVKSKYLNEALIRADYWHFGGVRLEDDVIVTATGCENITCCPREIADVEATMAGATLPFTPTMYLNQ